MKINKRGTYLPFAGVTVIAPIIEQDKPFWREVYSLLNQSVIKKYFTPLPHESYHMTTNNLVVEEGIDNWPEFIDHNLSFFQALSNTLAEHAHPLNVSFTNTTTQGAIQLIVTFNSPDNEEVIHNVAVKHRTTQGIPPQFHITLAYQYEEINDADRLAVLGIFQSIEQKFFNRSIQLNPPALHYFQDMKQYTPWDGTSNPFLSNDNNCSEHESSSFRCR